METVGLLKKPHCPSQLFPSYFDYQTLKLATLLTGDGTVFFVGTAEEWGAFAKDFYGP